MTDSLRTRPLDLRFWSVPVAAMIVMCSRAHSAELPSLAIEHCSVFDSTSTQMQSDRTVVVVGEQIKAVFAPGETVVIPENAVRIDGRGKYLLPGLIDAHVHLVHVLDYAHVTAD